MPKSVVKTLVIHSTEGSPEILYRGQNIHFVLLRDGTLQQVRATNIATDHGGIMANGKKKAIWNGDKSPTPPRIVLALNPRCARPSFPTKIHKEKSPRISRK